MQTKKFLIDFTNTTLNFLLYCSSLFRLYFKCRLWLTSRDPDDPPGPQQIAFINFIPQCVDQGGFFSGPKFEQFGDALNRMNENLKGQPIQGRLCQLTSRQTNPSNGFVPRQGNANL